MGAPSWAIPDGEDKKKAPSWAVPADPAKEVTQLTKQEKINRYRALLPKIGRNPKLVQD